MCPLLPQNCRLIVVYANERGTSLLYKSKVLNPVDNVPVYDVCLLLHGTTTLLPRCRRGLGGRTIAWNEKSKHYPVCHPRCLIGPNLRGLDVNSYEGLIRCKLLPPSGLRIPLLSCHINDKLMFVLYRACAETNNCGVSGHTRSERCLTGMWVSVELQKAVAIGYVIVEIYEAWNYDEMTVCDQATSE